MRPSKGKLGLISLLPDARALVVEDNEIRHDWFRANLPNVDIAVTVEDAINFLENNVYDVIFLDHDITTMIYPGDPNYKTLTYIGVAEYIKEHGRNHAMIVIHSGNPVGAANMDHLLQGDTEIGIFVWPFGTFEITIDR